MTITPLLPSDLPAALRLSTQADWNQLEADWRRMLDLWPTGCFAGKIGDELVATTTLANHGGHYGWVGHVLVDQAHRGQGYGGQMLDAMLEAAQDAGVKTLGLDATNLGQPLYLAQGFRDIGLLDRWVRHAEVILSKIAPAAKPIEPDSDPALWKDALALDLRAARLDRSALLTHLRDEPGVGWRALGNPEEMSAFAMIRPGRTASQIGPVIADSESAAIELLDSLLEGEAIGRNNPLQIDVPTGRLAVWLKSRGFNVLRSVTRMQAGIRGPDLLGPKVFAVSGFDLG